MRVGEKLLPTTDSFSLNMLVSKVTQWSTLFSGPNTKNTAVGPAPGFDRAGQKVCHGPLLHNSDLQNSLYTPRKIYLQLQIWPIITFLYQLGWPAIMQDRPPVFLIATQNEQFDQVPFLPP